MQIIFSNNKAGQNKTKKYVYNKNLMKTLIQKYII